jgi:hypothetical protein
VASIRAFVIKKRNISVIFDNVYVGGIGEGGGAVPSLASSLPSGLSSSSSALRSENKNF